MFRDCWVSIRICRSLLSTMAVSSYRYCVIPTWVFLLLFASCLKVSVPLADFFGKTNTEKCLECYGISMYSVKVYYSMSASHCALFCQKNDECFKFLYCGVPGSKNCYPIHRTGILSKESRIAKCTCHAKVAPQCDNGGILKDTKCECPTGFYGDRCEQVYESCEEAARNQVKGNSAIVIQPAGSNAHFPVLCDNGNNQSFTYIQRREKSGLSMRNTWLSYQQGFGGLKGSFWMGLNQIRYLLAPSRTNVLEIGLLCAIGDSDEFKVRTVQYANFSIGDEADGYTIHLDGFETDSDQSYYLEAALSSLNGQKFSTHDRDSSSEQCPSKTKSGWWYNLNCVSGNLNALYNPHYMPGVNITISAITWKVKDVFIHIQQTYMKIKSGEH